MADLIAGPLYRRRWGFLFLILNLSYNILLTSASGHHLNHILAYALFAAIAIAVNIGAQDAVTRLYAGTGALVVSMAIGTGAGLVVKYVLDKRYIFQFRTRDLRHDSTTFALYALFGLATTGIFWGVEMTFAHLFASRGMRYAGAVIGLVLGYAIKYFLDQRFVFRHARAGHGPRIAAARPCRVDE